MNTRKIITIAALAAGVAFGATACSSAASNSTPEDPPQTSQVYQTPQDELAAGLVGGTDSSTGATVDTATVGAMCSFPGDADALIVDQELSFGTSCTQANGTPSDPNWSQGLLTFANGEVQMSDGTQIVVRITVATDGTITWKGTRQ